MINRHLRSTALTSNGGTEHKSLKRDMSPIERSPIGKGADMADDLLAGAMLGTDLPRGSDPVIGDTPLGELMQSLAPRIEVDRQTLIGLIRRMAS